MYRRVHRCGVPVRIRDGIRYRVIAGDIGFHSVRHDSDIARDVPVLEVPRLHAVPRILDVELVACVDCRLVCAVHERGLPVRPIHLVGCSRIAHRDGGRGEERRTRCHDGGDCDGRRPVGSGSPDILSQLFSFSSYVLAVESFHPGDAECIPKRPSTSFAARTSSRHHTNRHRSYRMANRPRYSPDRNHLPSRMC